MKERRIVLLESVIKELKKKDINIISSPIHAKDTTTKFYALNASKKKKGVFMPFLLSIDKTSRGECVSVWTFHPMRNNFFEVEVFIKFEKERTYRLLLAGKMGVKNPLRVKVTTARSTLFLPTLSVFSSAHDDDYFSCIVHCIEVWGTSLSIIEIIALALCFAAAGMAGWSWKVFKICIAATNIPTLSLSFKDLYDCVSKCGERHL